MYSESQLKTARTVVLVCWIFGALSYFPPLSSMGIGALGRALFGLLFCVHLIEFIFFRKIYAADGQSMGAHFLRHMVYGVIYKTEVEQRNQGTGTA